MDMASGHNTNNLAKVEQESTSRLPIMTVGNMSPELIQRFELCCVAYFETKEIAPDKRVRKILGSFQDMCIQDWVAIEREHFTALGFEEFMKELQDAYLDENWEDMTCCELGAMRQGSDENFWDFAVCVQVKNSMLVGMGSHLDEEKICHRCESGMEEMLAMRCTGEKAHKKNGLKAWLNKVKRIDDKPEHECTHGLPGSVPTSF